MNPSDRIAIVGIGGVFAGSPTPDHLWQNVCAGTDCSSEISPEQWPLSPRPFLDPAPGQLDKVYSLRGYFIEDWKCEPEGLNIKPGLLARLDPLFHLTLRAAQTAWKDTITAPLDRRRVGAIFGNLVLPTDSATSLAETILPPTLAEQLGLPAVPHLSEIEPINAHAAGLPARLLARAFCLGGPVFNLDAACASSLFALKLAADELSSGRADAMFTGGVCRPNRMYPQMGFSQLRALSPTGRCRPFDAQADGLLVGEGAGLFVLKRLKDALEHGDKVYGVIAGVGLSNDTRGNLLSPDQEGQVRAMREAYQQAGWGPEAIDFIECHATGTPVGDPVELASLQVLWKGRPWQPGQCVLGSIKANVGHTLTAAGAAGLLKVLLSLHHRTLPPATNLTRPRGEVASEQSPFRLLRIPTEWRPRGPGIPRRAAISGFGFGGINAHVLIEEWIPQEVKVTGTTSYSTVPPPPGFVAVSRSPLAVVGIATRTGTVAEEVVDSERWWGVDQAAGLRQLVPEKWLRGHRLLEEVCLNPADFTIPPRDLKEMLPQQLLMLQVAAKALVKAGWSKKHALRTGAFVGLKLDLNATNFYVRWSMNTWARRWAEELGLELSEPELQTWARQLREAIGPAMNPGWALGSLASVTASRIARAFGMGGPSFTLANEEDSGLTALHVAWSLLQRNEIDFAMVGAVDLPGDIRELVSRNLVKRAESGFGSISLEGTSSGVCEGAAALVVRRLDDAIREGQHIFGTLRDNTAGCAGGPVLGLQSLIEATCSPAQAGGFELEMSDSSKSLRVRLGHSEVKVPPPPGGEILSRDKGKADSKADENGIPIEAKFDLPLFETEVAATFLTKPLVAALTAKAEAHAAYLQFSRRAMETIAHVAQMQLSSPENGAREPARVVPEVTVPPVEDYVPVTTNMFLDREQCLEFATGSIARVLGPAFAEVDTFPTRVRLPDEPLMLVDRVLTIEGEPGSLGSGSIVTEHDIQPGAWYLDNGRVCPCVALEAGQADLMLSGYLGADLRTRGLAMYRLLDATVTFHRSLPGPGHTLHYDIHIDRFFCQGDTHLFRFRYEATVDGEPLLTMTDGCAGFFTPAELAAGKGILPRDKKKIASGKRSSSEWKLPVPGSAGSLGTDQLNSLVQGDLARCFGKPFERLRLRQPLTLPGGRLKLLDRVAWLDPLGGNQGLGLVRAEQDVDPQAWFLTCHFVDDQVMPGTLMVDICLQAFRILLLRLGWVAETSLAHFEPVPGLSARLRCRGQVTAAVRTVTYEVSIQRIGFGPEPFAVADALLYADGRPIVEITGLNLRLTGVDQNYLQQIWK